MSQGRYAAESLYKYYIFENDVDAQIFLRELSQRFLLGYGGDGEIYQYNRVGSRIEVAEDGKYRLIVEYQVDKIHPGPPISTPNLFQKIFNLFKS